MRNKEEEKEGVSLCHMQNPQSSLVLWISKPACLPIESLFKITLSDYVVYYISHK